ncbi:MAG: ATP-binding cassette domain-containing protein [Bacillota bacterium]|nr:ATP-binding cassette domain-containing protein [Bacillota bacterium]
MAVLSLRGVGYAAGGRWLLRNVNLDLTAGSWAVVGPNGAGKTTLLRVLAGVYPPGAGQMYFRGERLSTPLDWRCYRDGLGYAPQFPAVYPELPPRAFLAYVASLKEIPPALVGPRVEKVLRLVGLDAGDGRPCRALSHGQRRRVTLAQALLNDPSLLILDEPTAGLDWESRWALTQIVLQFGKTRLVVFSTQDLADLEALATHVVVIDRGEIVLAGDREAFLAGAASPEEAYRRLVSAGAN